jgi:hypothetical protein
MTTFICGAVMKEISRYITDLKQTLDRLPHDPIQEAIMTLHEARLLKRQVPTSYVTFPRTPVKAAGPISA